MLQLVPGEPNPNRNQNVSNQAAVYLKSLSTLNRNMKVCIRSAQHNRDPMTRERFDIPENPIPEEPRKLQSP